MMPDKVELFVWVDLETTGLDPNVDTILEIAVILTDSNLRELGRFHRYVSNDTPTSSFVKKMHAKSGLTLALSQVQYFQSRIEIDKYLCDFLRSVNSPSRAAAYYFAGSSVHFDVDFIRLSFPNFAEMCSHRHLDVSSLILAHKIRNPNFKSKVKKVEPLHRAESDIQSSLDFARRYYGKKRRWKPLNRFNTGPK